MGNLVQFAPMWSALRRVSRLEGPSREVADPAHAGTQSCWKRNGLLWAWSVFSWLTIRNPLKPRPDCPGPEVGLWLGPVPWPDQDPAVEGLADTWWLHITHYLEQLTHRGCWGLADQWTIQSGFCRCVRGPSASGVWRAEEARRGRPAPARIHGGPEINNSSSTWQWRRSPGHLDTVKPGWCITTSAMSWLLLQPLGEETSEWRVRFDPSCVTRSLQATRRRLAVPHPPTTTILCRDSPVSLGARPRSSPITRWKHY